MPSPKQIALVVLLAVACAAAGFGLSMLQPERYSATTGLSFDSSLRPDLALTSQTAVLPPTDEQAETNAAAVDSYDVALATSKKTDTATTAVDENVVVAVKEGTQIVEITASAPSPAAAEDLARTYQEQYSSLRLREEQRSAEEARETLQDRLDDLSSQDEESTAGAALREQIASLDVLVAQGSGLPVVVESVNADPNPTQPRTIRNTGFGLVVGLVLGAGLVAIRKNRSGSTTEGSLAE